MSFEVVDGELRRATPAQRRATHLSTGAGSKIRSDGSRAAVHDSAELLPPCFIQDRMTRHRTFLIVFTLFVAGSALLSAMRGIFNEQRATETLSALSDAGASRDAAGVASRHVLPDIRFSDHGGGMRSLSDFGGRVLLLNIWATWCEPCRKEMAALDRLQQSLGNPQFEVVALSVDQGGIAAVDRFYRDTALTALRAYVDTSNEAAGGLGVAGIPTTLFIDTHGREVWRITGPVAWDKPEVIARMRREIERELSR